MGKTFFALTLLFMIFTITGCQLTYLFHAAAGQFRLLHGSVPVEEALSKENLPPEQKDRLRLVAQVKDFGEKELGLKSTLNYQTVYLKSRQRPIYCISASPKDRLILKTWWFPIAGKVPYLGFFDLDRARKERRRLQKHDLDVSIGVADAFSTLGWFRDPVTLNLIEGPTLNLVETILHEMTHSTFYLKDQSEFNEGLALIVGKAGTLEFTEKTYGSSHILAIEARNSIEDERAFSAFLSSLIKELETFYQSPISSEEKVRERERIFKKASGEFDLVKGRFKTTRFLHFNEAPLNNAYLLSAGLYHRHFILFEKVYEEKNRSVKEMLRYFKMLSKEKGDILEKCRQRQSVHIYEAKYDNRFARVNRTAD